MSHIAPWFPDAKFGVFIHWVLTGGPRNFRSDPDWRAAARANADGFTAERFDANEWGRMFASWGAKYAVLTTKHHIGFALYDCDATRFSARKSSPAKRDLVAEYVEGMRAHGLKVGLYFSLPDWCHPNYASLAGGTSPMKYSEKDEPERWQSFLDDMFAEMRHLCTAYGRIDLLWFDGDWERSAQQWKTVEFAAMIEELQPHCVINNRLRHKCLGHYGTPESNAPVFPRTEQFWEFCTTPGDNWAGVAANENVKQPPELVRIFGDNLGLGGNLLLNVAPAHDGTIPESQLSALRGLGSWITSHSEAVYGTESGLPADLFNGASTLRGSVLYLIAYDQPRDELVVKGLQSDVARVTHLASGRELAWRRSGGRAKFGQAGWLFIKLPPELMDEYATVVKVEFADDVLTCNTPSGSRTVKGRPVFEEQAVGENRAQ